MRIREICCLSAMLSAVVLCGCGGCGGPEQQAVKVSPKKAGRPVVKGPPPIPVRPKTAQEEIRPQTSGKKEESPAIDPSVDPNDVFAIVDESPTWEIIGREPEVEPADVFLAKVPAPGHSSSTFAVVERGKRPVVGEPDPDLQLPAGFTPIAEAGYSPDGLPWRIICDSDGSEMALVPGGVFVQGKEGSVPEAAPEHPHHLDPFYIQVTEVTVAQFEKFREARQEAKMRIPAPPLNETSPGNHPALGLLWVDARAYAAWGGRNLPTEAEWEKAARSEKGFAHPWGNGRAIWGRERSRSQIDPVKSFRMDKSVYGVYDLAGNAREWCYDWYSKTAYQGSLGKPLRNWKGPRKWSRKPLRAVRGNGPNWEAWHRGGVDMHERPADVGFRCVLRADPSKREGSREKKKTSGKASR